jgi:hypothetical protein
MRVLGIILLKVGEKIKQNGLLLLLLLLKSNFKFETHVSITILSVTTLYPNPFELVQDQVHALFF